MVVPSCTPRSSALSKVTLMQQRHVQQCVPSIHLLRSTTQCSVRLVRTPKIQEGSTQVQVRGLRDVVWFLFLTRTHVEVATLTMSSWFA